MEYGVRSTAITHFEATAKASLGSSFRVLLHGEQAVYGVVVRGETYILCSITQ